jgi:hypothetical protein
LPVNGDRLLEQPESDNKPLFRYWKESRKCTQVEVVSAKVGSRPRGGTAHLCGLQRRLNDSGNAESNFVLKLEDIFQRAVEAIGPKVRASEGID